MLIQQGVVESLQGKEGDEPSCPFPAWLANGQRPPNPMPVDRGVVQGFQRQGNDMWLLF